MTSITARHVAQMFGAQNAFQAHQVQQTQALKEQAKSPEALQALNPLTSAYPYTDLTTAAPYTLSLAPGQETEVTVVVNRSAMTAASGSLYGSLLRITDSLNYSKIDLGVSAVSSDFTGLWAGAVALSQVDQIEGNAVSPAPGPAQTTAIVAAGAVTGVTVNSTAAQFSSTPTVVFTGGGATGAAATAVIEKTFLARVTVTAGGTGYTSAPTISFTGGALDPNSYLMSGLV